MRPKQMEAVTSFCVHKKQKNIHCYYAQNFLIANFLIVAHDQFSDIL